MASPLEFDSPEAECLEWVNLSPVEFARLAIVRALARVGKDADLERRAARSDGHGWERVRQSIPDAPPQAGDELPR